MRRNSLNRKTRKPQAVRQDFNDAIDRLASGKPRHKFLKEQAAAGKLKITKSNVATEAGRSPALLWRNDYSDIRARIEDLKNPKRAADVPPTVAAVRNIRQAREEQIADAKRLWAETADLQAKILDMEREVARYREENLRLSKMAHQLRVENSALRKQAQGKNDVY